MSNFPINYVDTHCHLDLYNSPFDVVKEAEMASVLVIGVTDTPSVFPFTESLSRQFQNVIPALGIHPELAVQRKHELSLMWDFIGQTRFIGEIGLDYKTSDQADRKTQRDVFTQIIDRCAKYGNKILTVHSRRSVSDVINIIGEGFPGKVIMHWFSGSINQAEKAVMNGYYFSINSSMIRTKAGNSLVKIIPKDRVLTETDGPFIKINGAPVRPIDTTSVVHSLSQLYGLHGKEMKDQIWKNFLFLYKENS